MGYGSGCTIDMFANSLYLLVLTRKSTVNCFNLPSTLVSLFGLRFRNT